MCFQARSHSRKKANQFRHVCPSVCIHQRGSHRRISVKFDNGTLYENLSRKSKFGQNRTVLSNTLHDDPSGFYSHRRHKFALRALLCNTMFTVLTVTSSSTTHRKRSAAILLQPNVHPRARHEGSQVEQRYSSALSLTSGLDRSGWSMSCPDGFTPGKET